MSELFKLLPRDQRWRNVESFQDTEPGSTFRWLFLSKRHDAQLHAHAKQYWDDNARHPNPWTQIVRGTKVCTRGTAFHDPRGGKKLPKESGPTKEAKVLLKKVFPFIERPIVSRTFYARIDAKAFSMSISSYNMYFLTNLLILWMEAILQSERLLFDDENVSQVLLESIQDTTVRALVTDILAWCISEKFETISPENRNGISFVLVSKRRDFHQEGSKLLPISKATTIAEHEYRIRPIDNSVLVNTIGLIRHIFSAPAGRLLTFPKGCLCEVKPDFSPFSFRPVDVTYPPTRKELANLICAAARKLHMQRNGTDTRIKLHKENHQYCLTALNQCLSKEKVKLGANVDVMEFEVRQLPKNSWRIFMLCVTDRTGRSYDIGDTSMIAKCDVSTSVERPKTQLDNVQHLIDQLRHELTQYSSQANNDGGQQQRISKSTVEERLRETVPVPKEWISTMMIVLRAHPEDIYIRGCGLATKTNSLSVRGDGKLLVHRVCGTSTDWSHLESYECEAEGVIKLRAPRRVQKRDGYFPLPVAINPGHVKVRFMSELLTHCSAQLDKRDRRIKIFVSGADADTVNYILRSHPQYYSRLRGCGIEKVFVSLHETPRGTEPSFFIFRVCGMEEQFNYRSCFDENGILNCPESLERKREKKRAREE